MPTPDEIREYQTWRGRFISAVWDAEAVAEHHPMIFVPQIFETIGANQLTEATKRRIVSDLEDDHLLEGMAQSLGESYAMEVRLTSYGRMEVERWITEGAPTANFTLPPSQVFNNHFHAQVAGATFVQGATGTTVNMQTAVGEQMSTLIDKAQQLLATWNESGEAREEVEDDIATLQDQSAPAGRIKAALRRIGRWATGAAAAGAAAGLSEEVRELTGRILGQ